MKTNIEKFSRLGLREKKYARTKVQLLHALLERLTDKPLTGIKVQELCSAVEISQKTFFNYFLQKEHLLNYFIQLYSLKMAHVSSKIVAQSDNPIEAIFEIFRTTADDLKINPNIMIEIINFQNTNTPLQLHTISNAEKWYAFDELEGVEELEGYGLDYIVPQLLQAAHEKRVLADSVDLDKLYISILSLFYGTSVLLLKREPQRYPAYLSSSLETLFKGVGYTRQNHKKEPS